MDREYFFKKVETFQVLIIGLFFALSILVSTKIIASTLSRSGIEVTGSAIAIVKSDFASWNLDITTSAKTTKQAFSQLVTNKNIVYNYLKSKGFTDNDIDFQHTNTYPVYKVAPDTGEPLSTVDYYTASQTIVVTSNNIPLIKNISLDVENLLNKGIDLKSNPPAYFYTKLADLKIQLLNEASDDAKKRAKAMLKSTGSRVGTIKSIKTGVFQITPPNSTDVSDYGYYDTSTIDKKVTAVTQVTFRIK